MTIPVEVRLSACCDLAAFLAVIVVLLGGLAFAQHEALLSAREEAVRCGVRP